VSASKVLTFGRFRVSPKIDVFNLLNSDDYQSVRTLQYGGLTYNQPNTIMQGRIIRIGGDVKW
jgi:hypothetical protein